MRLPDMAANGWLAPLPSAPIWKLVPIWQAVATALFAPIAPEWNISVPLVLEKRAAHFILGKTYGDMERHDLSASDLAQLDRIELEGLSLA